MAFIEATLQTEIDDCVMWPFSTNTGYGQINIGNRPQHVSRIICTRVYGDPKGNRNHVAHSCGERKCVNPKHLRWATRAENEADKVLHGRSNRGERSGSAKLTPAEVLLIRTSNEIQEKLATKYGVSQSTISFIRARKTWAYLEDFR